MSDHGQSPRRSSHRLHQPDVLALDEALPPAMPDALAPATQQPSKSAALLVTLSGYGVAVREIGAALGRSPAQMAATEALDRLEILATLPLEKLAAWDIAAVAAWFAAFGTDLRLDLSLSGLDLPADAPVAALRSVQAPQEALTHFIEEAQTLAENQGDEVMVEARLSLGKAQAAASAHALLAARQEYLGTPEMLANTKIAIVYHAPAFHRLLAPTALSDWERLGLARTDGRAFVVLCDSAGYLAGIALEVLGAQTADEPHWLLLSRAAWRQFNERAHEIRQLRDDETLWASAPQALTPAHLRAVQRASGLEATAALLAETHAALAAAYLASSVQRAADGSLSLRFAGARPCACALPRTPSISTNISGQRDTAFTDAALARLAAWAYDHASPDKLVIAREALARELPAGGMMTLAQIEHAAAGALEVARANFAIYLRHNTEQYFQLRQQALDAVSAYAETVRKSVSDLTGDVVDNVYRTVGLLVGVIIAGLLQPSLSLTIERLAVLLYTAYIAFTLWFLLGARERRFTLESRDLDQRLAAMPELSETERARLRQQPTAEQAYFRTYFHWTQRIYLALAILGTLYFILLLTPLGQHLSLPHT